MEYLIVDAKQLPSPFVERMRAGCLLSAIELGPDSIVLDRVAIVASA